MITSSQLCSFFRGFRHLTAQSKRAKHVCVIIERTFREGNTDRRGAWILGIEPINDKLSDDVMSRIQDDVSRVCFHTGTSGMSLWLTMASWSKLFLWFCASPDPGFCQNTTLTNHQPQISFRNWRETSDIQKLSADLRFQNPLRPLKALTDLFDDFSEQGVD